MRCPGLSQTTTHSQTRSFRQLKFWPQLSGQVVVVVVVVSLLISGLEGDGNQCNCTTVYRPPLYSHCVLYKPHHSHTLSHCREGGGGMVDDVPNVN